ncbi:MAG: PilZ domain-containing protein, partial [Chitinivibrionales bacterium]|nr:PilZ domain-containing protein [Chitinivibrionales bacterium]
MVSPVRAGKLILFWIRTAPIKPLFAWPFFPAAGMLWPVYADLNDDANVGYLHWQGPGLTEIIGMILFVAALCTPILFLYLRGRRKAQKEQQADDQKLFLDQVQRAELTAEEQVRLTALLKHERSLQPQVIFQSLPFFERCVDTEIARLRQRASSPDEQAHYDAVLGSLRRKLGYLTLPFETPLVSTRNIALGQQGSLYGRSNRIPLIPLVHVVENTEFHFTLEFATEGHELIGVEPGAGLRFIFTRKNDGVYGVAVTMAGGSFTKGSLLFWHTLDLKRNQLRQHVRMEVSLPVKVRLIKTQDAQTSSLKVGEILEAKMSDLSGGGLSFLADKSLKPGDSVTLQFTLPQGVFAGCPAKI